MTASRFAVSKSQARRIWLHAQRLDTPTPFGDGPEAVRQAVEHLGYVQIDTINVIERCHHHILFTRIPGYRRSDLRQTQSQDKTVFEYWTHALSYVPARDFAYFQPAMRQHKRAPGRWFEQVTPQNLRKVLALIEREGPLTIRDIDDDVLVEKDHPWASRKPSKRALQLAFFTGDVTVNERAGMLKSYELTDRHFGWDRRPKPAPERDLTAYVLDRALKAQGIVSLDSICHLDAKRKPAVRHLIDARARRKELLPVQLEGADGVAYWVRPEALDRGDAPTEPRVHILSPFDPLVIQRKRLQAIFSYEHRFEAYLPRDKRVFGYFALPVLHGEEIVAAIDLKADRAQQKLLVQQWTWIGSGTPRRHQRLIEDELHRFERFQLAGRQEAAIAD